MHRNEIGAHCIDFIDNSITPFHAVKEIAHKLRKKSFQELQLSQHWVLERGEKYFTVINSSMLVAVVTGSVEKEHSFRIAASHVDSPGFRIKPNPEVISEKQYLTLNTEVYGGPILHTWLDRPLSLAGRVITKGNSPFFPESHLVNFKKSLMTIPSLAIHQDRDINKGREMKQQKEFLPLLSLVDEEFKKHNFLLELLNEEIDSEDIIDADLFLYDTTGGAEVGVRGEFLSSARIDNLASVFSSMSLLDSEKEMPHHRVLVFFNNEEVGSMTGQGADSPQLAYILERIVASLGGSRKDYLVSLPNSFLISADGAHGVHPNYGEKSDPTSRPFLGKGPVLKQSASMSYTTDGRTASIMRELFNQAGIPLQDFVNRSGERGGTTIGPVSSSHLPIPSVDIGIPMLAMHSSRELAATADIAYLSEAISYIMDYER